MNPITDAILLREASATTRMSLDLHDGEHVSDKLTGGTSYYTPLPTPEELVDWMAQVEMAPETLAARLEVPIKYVNEILTGQTEMPTHTWFALGKIIGMTNQERSVIAQRNYAVPPGEWVTEWLEENSVTLTQLAFDLGVNPSYAQELVEGKMPVSPSVAIQLEHLTGIPVKSWTRLDTQYWQDKERIARESAVVSDRAARRDQLLGQIVEEDEPLLHRLADER